MGVYSVKGMLVRNIIFLSITVIGLGYTDGCTRIIDYLDLIYNNILFVLVTALIYVTASNTVKLRDNCSLIPKQSAHSK